MSSGEQEKNGVRRFYEFILGINYERNVGGLERTFRYTSGVVLILAGIGLLLFPMIGNALANTVVALLLGVGGVYELYEARVQYCPLNQTLDRNTYSDE